MSAVAFAKAVYITATAEKQRVDRSLTRERVVAYLAATFAALAIFLSALGLYGVLSFGIARRTKEIGVRVALGAGHGEVVGIVLRQSAMSTFAGLAGGLLVSAGAARYLTGRLFGLTPLDPSAFAGACVIFVAVALLASYLPARRALRVDPIVALRCD